MKIFEVFENAFIQSTLPVSHYKWDGNYNDFLLDALQRDQSAIKSEYKLEWFKWCIIYWKYLPPENNEFHVINGYIIGKIYERFIQ